MVVIAVNGAFSAPAGTRLLRRVLLIAGIAAAGWLLSMLFAGTAAADSPPPATGPAETPAAEAGADYGGHGGWVAEPATQSTTGTTTTPAWGSAAPQPGSAIHASQPAEGAGPATPTGSATPTSPISSTTDGEAAAPVAESEPAPDDASSYEMTAAEGGHSSGGLLGGLVSGLTSTVNDLTQTLSNLLGAAPLLPMPDAPDDGGIIDLLPAPGGDDIVSTPVEGIVGEARAEITPVGSGTPPPAVRPTAAPAPAPQQHRWHQPLVASQVVAPATDTNAAAHATDSNDGGGDHQPPRAPSAPGSTVSTAHDNSGGARGAQGVLSTLATPMPADAGFTTRSRAARAIGRGAGLPAASPD